MPKRTRARRVKVAAGARDPRATTRRARLIDQDAVRERARCERVEQTGIVFIDEIDKIARRASTHGADVSREGVQRDLLPIVEGTTVQTKHGTVRTDHVLFIAAGAFHVSRPSRPDPRAAGPLPDPRRARGARTRRHSCGSSTEPHNALVKQYQALLATENVRLEFKPRRDRARSRGIAAEVNRSTENIGARRLHTVLERLLDETLRSRRPTAAARAKSSTRARVRDRLTEIAGDRELARFIL